MSKHILLTGATGFVGQRLLPQLLSNDYRVVAAVRKQQPFDARVQQVVVPDFSSDSAWEGVPGNIDTIIHVAARAHVMSESSDDPERAFKDANVAPTEALAQWAIKNGVKRFIFISTIKVNGEGGSQCVPYSAQDEPQPQDAYARSKWSAEQRLTDLLSKTNTEWTIIRPPLLYGPGVKGNFRSMLKIAQVKVPLPLGSLHNKRSLMYVDNLVDLILTCVVHPQARNQTFLAADGEDVSTTELLRRIRLAMGASPWLIPLPPFIFHWLGVLTGKQSVVNRLCGSLCIDVSEVVQRLDWKPPYSLDQGLRATLSHL